MSVFETESLDKVWEGIEGIASIGLFLLGMEKLIEYISIAFSLIQ